MATPTDFDRIGNYARMYNRDQNIDRSSRSRTVPMEVLSLGYSRTGTMSMRAALEILGYPNPYHFSSFYDNVRETDIWRQLIHQKYFGRGGPVRKEQFDGLLGHCGAVTDMPCHLFAPELMEFYPDAKVVLVERNLDSWLKSWYVFLDNAFDPTLWYASFLDPLWMGRIVGVGVAGVDIQVGSGKTVDAAKARSKEEYLKHYALVRSLASKDRILEYRLGDGWDPLCKFLGKPVPNVPFPSENDSKKNGQSFAELAQIGLKRGLANVVMVVTAVALPVLAVLWARK